MTEDEFRQLGEAQLGKPYVFGAEGADSFDCSGLVKFMLAAVGIHPAGRSAQDQHNYFANSAHGVPIALDQRRLGDLCFYGANANDVNHVTISWTGGKVLEAGLGTRTTTTVEEARRIGAKVMISAVDRHRHLLDAFRPRGLPWESGAHPLVAHVDPIAVAGLNGASPAELVDRSPLRTYDWPHRGVAPRAYLVGMVTAFLEAHRLLMDRQSGAPATPAPIRTALQIATSSNLGSDSHDVLAWYSKELGAVKAGTATATDRLVAVFAIMIGLGMRESSGRYCVGADTPESRGEPTTPENAEAGLFQVSWDSIHENPDRNALFLLMKDGGDLFDVFSTGVSCRGDDLVIHGGGEQAAFQTAMKQNPFFACLYTAMFLRQVRGHWGPINTRKAEVKADAVSLLRGVLT